MRNLKRHVSVDEALKRLFNSLGDAGLGYETVLLKEALGRVLADDIHSPMDMPPHHRAAMDGYAVKAEDTSKASSANPVMLKLVGEIAIGSLPKVDVRSGEAVSAATGSYMPAGANAVVMVENAKTEGEMVEVVAPVTPWKNVSRVGEDLSRGQMVLEAGPKLRPQDIGMLSGLGIVEVNVVRKPVVAVISTGDELVRSGEELKPGKTYDVNGLGVASMVADCGAIPLDLGIAIDREDKIREKLEEGVAKADGIIISAGSSVGKNDIVPEIVNHLGHPGVLVHGVAIRPGSPTGLAVVNGKAILILPGYPVAAIVAFHVFGRPLVAKLCKTKPDPQPKVRAKMKRGVTSERGIANFVRVRLQQEENNFVAEPIHGGSSVLSSLTSANGLLIIPEERERVEEGEEVEVTLLRPV